MCLFNYFSMESVFLHDCNTNLPKQSLSDVLKWPVCKSQAWFKVLGTPTKPTEDMLWIVCSGTYQCVKTTQSCNMIFFLTVMPVCEISTCSNAHSTLQHNLNRNKQIFSIYFKNIPQVYLRLKVQSQDSVQGTAENRGSYQKSTDSLNYSDAIINGTSKIQQLNSTAVISKLSPVLKE